MTSRASRSSCRRTSAPSHSPPAGPQGPDESTRERRFRCYGSWERPLEGRAMQFLRSSALLCGLVLVACGGGGGSNNGSNPDAPPGGAADARPSDAGGVCGGVDENGVCATSTQIQVC